MPKPVIVIKIDPEKRRIVRIPIQPSVPGVRRMLGCANIGHRVLVEDIDGESLLVAARVDRDPKRELKEWRLRGGVNTVGVGLLFGTLTLHGEEASKLGHPDGHRPNGMWHVPVDVAWVERRIVWCEPGEDAPAAEVREEMGIPE